MKTKDSFVFCWNKKSDSFFYSKVKTTVFFLEWDYVLEIWADNYNQAYEKFLEYKKAFDEFQ